MPTPTPTDLTQGEIIPEPEPRWSALRVLNASYPDADCALEHRNAWELLAATVLSAQSTDRRVNLVTRELFARYPDAQALAAALPATLEAIIRSVGCFRVKARNLIALSQQLVADHDGRVPDSLDALTALPGVGRKTALVVLGTAFLRTEGIVVDTHVFRVAKRLGWASADAKTPERVEAELQAWIPREFWTPVSHRLITHGRQVCHARKPHCRACPTATYCPTAADHPRG